MRDAYDLRIKGHIANHQQTRVYTLFAIRSFPVNKCSVHFQKKSVCSPQRTPRTYRKLHSLHAAVCRISRRCKRKRSIASPFDGIFIKYNGTYPPLTRAGYYYFVRENFIRCQSWGLHSLVDSRASLLSHPFSSVTKGFQAAQSLPSRASLLPSP